MPSIDWRTYLAGSLASVSVILALSIMFTSQSDFHWYRLAGQAAVAGPVWAHLTVVFYALRFDRSYLVLRPRVFILAVLLAMVMPLGVVNDTPIPWVYFLVREFFYPEFSFQVLGVFWLAWVGVWAVMIPPVFRMYDKKDRFTRLLILVLSMAYGVIPSLTLFFMGLY